MCKSMDRCETKKKEKQVVNLNKVMRALKFRKNHKSKESAKSKTADVNTI